ncbi:efflux RND transporter periplasmic adaptor subunit [Sphingomonas sp. MMS24-J13]|uniref:efflux RND transporter periplasmic adaptor subunit n=1 Tax=Sphingomonas sp. MMS24-J13 TaxID=3238686 RepID=UPI00384BA1C7
MPAAAGGRTFDCIIEAFQIVKLASPVVGVVGKMYVERGDVVHRGQIVGKLEDRVEAANLALAKAKALDEYNSGAIRAHLDFLRSRQARTEQLAQRNFVTKAARDEAISDTHVAEQQLAGADLSRRVAQIEVRHAQSLLDQKLLRSPVDGVVTEILLRPGEYRNEQSPILTIAQVNPLRVEVFVPTRYYGQIMPKMAATVMPEAPVGGTHPATVSIVDRVIDAASGTFGVRLLMPNGAREVPAGLKCKVRFG